MIKNELQHIFSGQSEVKFGATIQAIIGYLAGSEESGKTSQQDKHFRKEETKKLISWIENENFWYPNIDFNSFVSEGAEQRVFLNNEFEVLKLNDGIYYSSWKEYLQNLLLNNYFFPDTAYELLGFYSENEILYAVVRQKFVKSNEVTNLEKVKEFLKNNGFKNIRNNDYYNEDLGIILEDLHDENVLTQNGILFFIDTVFYTNENFYK
mgnify:CR=1 FL=1